MQATHKDAKWLYEHSGYLTKASPGGIIVTGIVLVVGGCLFFAEHIHRCIKGKKPKLAYVAHQFIDVTFDHTSGIWLDKSSQYSSKAFVLHFANLDDDGHGVPARGLRAQIRWEYSHNSSGPAFMPAAWADEERGVVDIETGCSKKLIIGIRHDSPGMPLGTYWEGISNPRTLPGDRHRLDIQPIPSHGKFIIRFIWENEVLCEVPFSWEEDLRFNATPTVRQLPIP